MLIKNININASDFLAVNLKVQVCYTVDLGKCRVLV